MQAVVVTDPYLIAEILGKNTEIEKSIAGVYSKFNVVRKSAVPVFWQLKHWNALGPSACFCAWQLLHAGGMPNIFTSPTDDYWRLIRKGVAPAFSPKNIRYKLLEQEHRGPSKVHACIYAS